MDMKLATRPVGLRGITAPRRAQRCDERRVLGARTRFKDAASGGRHHAIAVSTLSDQYRVTAV